MRGGAAGPARGALLPLLAALALASCTELTPPGPGRGPPPVEGVLGDYALEAVNGEPLPYLVTDDPDRVEITRANLVLRSNHTFGLSTFLDVTPPGGIPLEHPGHEVGSWSREGDTLTLVLDHGGGYTEDLSGQLDDDRHLEITRAQQGLVLRFRPL
jgi:hypothetical protein